MPISMSRSATPGRLSIDEYDIIAEVCKGGRVPHTESIFKAIEKYYSSFPCCQPQHFWRSGNCSNLGSTWEAIELIEYFVDCQSSVRSRREAKDINVPYSVWDGCRHILRKTGSQKQQFALWVITSENFANCSDPRGMGWSCMRWPDCSSSQ